jgi:hypothetical protein
MKEEIKRFKVLRGEDRVKIAWKVVREVAKLSDSEPFWNKLKESYSIKEKDIKEIMRFLEESNELEIKRSRDGKRLYVSTLKGIKEHPLTLEKWIKVKT